MKGQRLLVLAAFALAAGACSSDTELPTAVPDAEAAAVIPNPVFAVTGPGSAFFAADEMEIPDPQVLSFISPYAAFSFLGPLRVVGVDYMSGGESGWLGGGVELKSAFRSDLNLRVTRGLPIGAYTARVTMTLLGVVNYTVDVTFVSGLYYGDCAESAAGWSFTGLWNLTAGGNTMNPRGATPAPDEGNSYFWYGSPATGDFNFGTNSGSAVGPVFTLPAGATYPVVRLRTWFEIEYDVSPFSYDYMEVWLVEEGTGTRTFVGRINGSPYFVGNGNSFGGGNPWVDFEAPIPGSAFGGNYSLELHFESRDGAYNDYRGWGVDCMLVIESNPPVGAAAATARRMSPWLLEGATEPVQRVDGLRRH